MKILLFLSEADQNRFGCGPQLEVNPFAVTAREAAAIQEPFFPKHDGFVSPKEWRDALRGTPLVDQYGAPVMVEVEEDGETKQQQKRKPDYAANAVVVWLGLRRAGVNVELADLDYDTDAFRWSFQTDQPEGQGKDDSDPATTSED